MSGSDGLHCSVTKIDLNSLREAGMDRVHMLPCEVEHNGEAKVDQYFTPAIRTTNSEMLVSFRGRSLKGEVVTIPKGYVGLILKEDHKPYSEEEDRTVRIKSTFSTFTRWNLETSPNSDDSVMMTLAWPELAEAIHAPVEDS